MANSKRFVQSSVREIEWQYWKFYNIDISKEDFLKLPVNESWYVKMTMSAFKDWPNQYWNSHYLVLNEWKPKANSGWDQEITDAVVPTAEDEEVLPF